jgi:hypothetical protein
MKASRGQENLRTQATGLGKPGQHSCCHVRGYAEGARNLMEGAEASDRTRESVGRAAAARSSADSAGERKPMRGSSVKFICPAAVAGEYPEAQPVGTEGMRGAIESKQIASRQWSIL